MKKIVLFTGAGAVKPLGLPLTTDFYDDIVSRRPELEDVFKNLADSTSDYKDIEYIVETLENLVNASSVTKYIIDKRISDKNVKSQIHDLISNFNDYLLEIKLLILKKLRMFSVKDAAQYYSLLVKEVIDLYGECSIVWFTTNYDLTFEKALTYNNTFKDLDIASVDFGFHLDEWTGRQIFYQGDQGWKENVLVYRKLHGSLDWLRDKGECIKSGVEIIPNDPTDAFLIYPGTKMYRELEPFASLHNLLFKKLDEADVIIIVGFAFRDININHILKGETISFCSKEDSKIEMGSDSRYTGGVCQTKD